MVKGLKKLAQQAAKIWRRNLDRKKLLENDRKIFPSDFFLFNYFLCAGFVFSL